MKKSATFFLSLLFFCFALNTSSSAQNAETNGHWVSVWGIAEYAPFKFIPMPPEPDFSDVTIRMIVRPSIGSHRLRIRLSNEYGTSPLTIDAAHIALTDAGSKIVPETDRTLKFGGNSKVSIPAGAPIVSDPIDLPVKPLTEISISIYLPSNTPVSTWHRGSNRDTYIAGPGDRTSQIDLPDSKTKSAWYFLSSVEMWESNTTTTAVAFGDSITEGSNTGVAYTDYPDQLSERLVRDKIDPPIAVINEGIGGNRILHNAAGDSALARFDKDVLSHPGVTDLIVLEGINDIGFPRVKADRLKIPNFKMTDFSPELVSADEIIAGLEQMIVRAHEHGISVLGATMTPYDGAVAYDADGEAIRQAVNKWIRAANAFDHVIDFDAVVRDPEHPARLRAGFDSGDHIHPNPAGYKAMADSIVVSDLKATRQ